MKKIVVDNQILGQAIIDTLREGQKVSFTVKGSSMRPFFYDGRTTVNITKKDTYHKKDVIFFRYQQTLKLHRIKSIKDQHVTASGDNLLQNEIIQVGDIIGYVESYQNNHKKIYTKSVIYKTRVFFWLLIKPFVLRLVRR